MSTSFVDEYLVKLGSSVDASGMARFQQALREASSVADHSASSIAGSFFKAQTEITAGFAAIGSAAIGLVDKVAMADQQYRLFALHMHLATREGMALKITMDALGASLEDITWDPTKELTKRAVELNTLQAKLMGGAAVNSEDQLQKVRDIRFQFTELEVQLQYLERYVVVDFLNALGTGPDELLAKLKWFNDWVQHNMPQISAKIVSTFLPVWHDVEAVGRATAKAFEAAGLAFTNVVGIFDHSLGGTTFDFEKFGKAIVDIVDTFANWAVAIANVEEGLLHLVSALALVAQGKFGAAGKELGAAGDDVNAGSIGGAIVPGAIGSYFGWQMLKKMFGSKLAKKLLGRGALAGEAEVGAEAAIGVEGAEVGGEVGMFGGPVGAVLGAAAGAGLALGGSWLGANLMRKGTGAGSVSKSDSTEDVNMDVGAKAMPLAESVSRATGIPADVIWSQWATETNGFKHIAKPNNLAGVNVPGGKGQDYRSFDSLQDFGVYYSMLMRPNGLYPGAHSAKGTDEFASVLKAGGYYAGKETDYAARMRHFDKMYKPSGGGSTATTSSIGHVTINVSQRPGENGTELAKRVTANIRGVQDRKVQRNLAEFQDTGWSG